MAKKIKLTIIESFEVLPKNEIFLTFLTDFLLGVQVEGKKVESSQYNWIWEDARLGEVSSEGRISTFTNIGVTKILVEDKS
jgi:hypothetical protein